jgi:hypothetical protein
MSCKNTAAINIKQIELIYETIDKIYTFVKM